VDLRRKLPFVVGVLHRMLRRSHRVYVTCTNGLERSPSCVIGYLHWIQDVSLPQAYEFVTAMHPSGPDRLVTCCHPTVVVELSGRSGISTATSEDWHPYGQEAAELQFKIHCKYC